MAERARTEISDRKPGWQKRAVAPWRDRAGRFSRLKALTLLLVSLPGLILVFSWALYGLGPRPVTEAIHQTGDWTVRLLLVTLSITPARRILDWSRLILVRRMIGLAALTYVLFHLALYIVDLSFDLVAVASEIGLRIYLAIGFATLLGLAALGVTSTDAAIRRMGKNWVMLHQSIYPLAFLAHLHFLMQSKLNVTQPVLTSGVLIYLLLFRLMRRFGVTIGALTLLGLAVAAGLGTALVEFAWYGLATEVDPWRVLSANLDFAYTIRPSWYVFAGGVLVVILFWARRLRLPFGDRSDPALRN